MKKFCLLFLFFSGVFCVNSQTPVTLTFMAKDSISQHHVAWDSVRVKNLTRGCDTLLSWPDSVLSIIALWPTGIEQIQGNTAEEFILMQNYPNPFEGSAIVNIYRKYGGRLNLVLFDMTGTKLADFRNDFDKGMLSFIVSAPGTQVLHLAAFDDRNNRSIKMISAGNRNGVNSIEYLDNSQNVDKGRLERLNNAVFVFYLHDNLKYIAHACGYKDNTKYDSPSTNTAYNFRMTTLSVVLTVTTSPVTNITQTTATSGGNVTPNGGAPATSRGVCWSTIPAPTIADSHTTDGSGPGGFVSNLAGLTGGTLYHVRAYATNCADTTYGNELTFTTLACPGVTTAPVTSVSQTTATSGGMVFYDGGANVTARGVCWSASQPPTIADSHTMDGSGTGAFVSYLTGLTCGTLYHVRAYATNSGCTSYGNDFIFQTLTLTFSCNAPFTFNHVEGVVSPVTKTVTYGTVSSVPGEPSKCWITSNLGSDHQANAVSDTSEASAGWYWQFDKMLGYKHTGTTRIPSTIWISSINENSDWVAAQDPCSLLFCSGWRIPTKTEWTNVYAAGGWTNWTGPWNSMLKLHAAGKLWNSDGSLSGRGILGYYWSSTQNNSSRAYYLYFSNGPSNIYEDYKTLGFTLRCINNSISLTVATVTTTPATNIAQTTATTGGNVIADGGATVTARGVCWSTLPTPTMAGNYSVDGSGTGSFTSYLSGLTPNTTYYVRAYAINSAGTVYGTEVVFSTLP